MGAQCSTTCDTLAEPACNLQITPLLSVQSWWKSMYNSWLMDDPRWKGCLDTTQNEASLTDIKPVNALYTWGG